MALSLRTRFKLALVLVRANWLAGKKDYEKGIRLIEETFSEPDGHVNLSQIPLVIQVRYLSLLYKAQRFIEGLPVLQAAVSDLDRGRDSCNNRTITKANREYLYFYCRWLACLFPRGSEAFHIALIMGGSYQAIDLAATSSLLKSVFPITPGAGRHVDAFIEANMPRLAERLA